MDILVLTEFFPKTDKTEISGGVETRAFYIAKELAKKNSVTVICSREKGTKKKDIFSGIKVVRCGKERKYSQAGSITDRMSFMFAAYNEGKKIKADIVDGYNFISYSPAYWIAKSKKIPCVATYHDVWLNQWIKNIGPSGILMELLERYVLSLKWTGFIANSEYTKKNLIRIGIKEQKIDVVYSGVNLEDYKSQNTKEKGLSICAVSRLVKYKRIDDLILAAAKIKQKYPDMAINIIGDGSEKNNLKKLAKELGISSNVNFLGYLNHGEVLQELKKATLFSLPSVVEGMGLVTVEAMACRTPYVNSRIPPQVEITDNGKGGLLFEPKDHLDLSKKLLLLLDDKELYKKKQEECSKLAKKFDWINLAKKIEKVYEKCLR
ncbi:MAG: glycosyltransferase family 4 protein [archaeon]